MALLKEKPAPASRVWVWPVNNWNRAIPSLHDRKEGWPSDQKIIAKPPLIARPGWFSDENKRKTTPAASASVAARNFLDDAATRPCGDARRGITLDSNLFTAPMTADNISPEDRGRS